jgi:hypothetical protein
MWFNTFRPKGSRDTKGGSLVSMRKLSEKIIVTCGFLSLNF